MPNLKIQVGKQELFTERGVTVPGTIWKHRPFPFQPNSYMIGNDYLKSKLIDAQVQTNSLEGFMENPSSPMLYAVGSEPTPEKALYFAAFLLQYHLQHTRNTLARWYPLWERSDIVKNPAHISFLVITDVYKGMTNWRLEKLRDILAAYSSIPRVLVVGGVDPATFCLSELFIRNTHLFHATSASVNRKVEIV